MLCVFALAALACRRPAPAKEPAATGSADVIAALRADLILAIERDAPLAQNACAAASALVVAARDASGDVARRLRDRARVMVAPALPSGQPDCMVDAAARLVPLLPAAERGALVSALIHLYEKGLDGWGLYRGVMPAIAPHLTSEEASRLARAVPDGKGPPCVRTIVLVHLADAGWVRPAEAFSAIRATQDQSCLESDELHVLRFADTPTLRALYPREMAMFDDSPAAWDLGHVLALAALAPYLEPQRRPALLAAAFHVMPAIYVSSPRGRETWGELPPEFHFQMAMMQLAPLVDDSLLKAALAAIPSVWSDESKGYAVAVIGAALPAPLRRARRHDLLAAMPGVRGSKAASAARLALAADLPPEEVHEALDVVIEGEQLPSTRVRAMAGALRALPAASLPSYAARVRADVAGGADADGRISDAALVLNLLHGVEPP